MSTPPDEQRFRDPVRQGPLCRTCAASSIGSACTDCALRAGLQTRDFPTLMMLPENPPRWVARVIIGCLVTVFLLGSLLTAIDRTAFGATHAVDDFFTALRSRDAAAALALTDRRVHPLTTSAMIKNSGYRPPSKWKAKIVHGGFRAATVAVSYTIDGRRLSQNVQLERIGYRSGVFSRWSVSSMPELNVIMPSTGLLVAGTEVSAEQSLRHAPVLPGSYLVEVPKNSIVALKEQVVALPSRASQSESPILAAISPGAQKKAEAAVKSLFASCAKSTDLQPPGCPFAGATGCNTVSPVHWTIAGIPAVRLAQAPEAAKPDDPTPRSTVYLVSDRDAGDVSFEMDCEGFPSGQQVPVDLSGWTVRQSGGEVSLDPPDQD